MKVPDGWRAVSLSECAKVERGKFAHRPRNEPRFYGGSMPFVQTGEVSNAQGVIRSYSQTLNEEGVAISKVFPKGTLLMTIAANIGDVAELGFDAACPDSLVAILPSDGVCRGYLRRYLERQKPRIHYLAPQNAQKNINVDFLERLAVLLPPDEEQRKISDLFDLCDAGTGKLGDLLEAKRAYKRGLMQQLLTGRKRFKEFVKSRHQVKTRYGCFPVDWTAAHIGDLADEVRETNGGGHALPVLSCTKYRGLVNSLEYFGKRVFSADTSNYKVVRRGDFAYATNHIEEGSIGYQDLHDAALISPMYTVFRTRAGVDHSFFFKLVKTELYRHIFEVNTSGSIARRGGLRWDEFAIIKVFLPSVPEQRRIAAVLSACDREIELLQKQLEALKEQKRGLMQKLLTGEVRVKAESRAG